ncbi:3-galactosyl-N-acetylglucosaminide 4-alpha-L-fucosyltransferase FUT3 [Patella vulgata]|uniref:3-galactosyl-N-acetylglucosaminide 4-alpha-L-fucosyltransferase FUT3 n=1 Tax=Patella vulgata TaxID=6465 RepID=UPI00218012DB|nr:3-galactosyl-N-acetylglucosaminide 4-alpha-L-fucosyltransferase FUT3 [Patella vulgata]XP_055959468.1 3-galactosyl-N-acetylglucosaminide 4-alpha-L-fucosyltransferase FUT3 [Patella vulgata]
MAFKTKLTFVLLIVCSLFMFYFYLLCSTNDCEQFKITGLSSWANITTSINGSLESSMRLSVSNWGSRSPASKTQVKRIRWENAPPWLPEDLQDGAVFANCEIKSCVIVNELEAAHGVIIYMVSYQRLPPFPRPPGQVWVLFGLESPPHSNSQVFKHPVWQSQINWTMTYRLDSTIPIPYGQTLHRPVREQPDLKQILVKKTKLIAWVVSNCVTESQRRKYVQLLQTHLREPVDIYGRCGTLDPGPGEGVFNTISEKYKFYLAFENSLCVDYVTEKFHQRQNLNLIVIVRGGGNYSHFYPKKSLLDTNDFTTTKELAEYIHYLDRNNTAYLEYLSNKAPFVAKDSIYTMSNGVCEICKRLHEPIVQTCYKNIGNWWYQNACHEPKDLL